MAAGESMSSETSHGPEHHGPGTLQLILWRLEKIESNTQGLVSNVRYELESKMYSKRLTAIEDEARQRKAQAARIRVGLVLALTTAVLGNWPGLADIIGGIFS